MRSVCMAALSRAGAEAADGVFVDLQKPGADNTVFFGGPIFWARAVAADTESVTVYDLVCGVKEYIDDPANKGALDVVKDNSQYKRFCEYLEAATKCLSEKTRAILMKRKQMVLTQQLGMYPLDDPEDVDGGSVGRLKAEFTSSPIPLLEAAVSGGTYKAAPENIGAPNRRNGSPLEGAKDAGTPEKSGGGAASGGDGDTDGADAERESRVAIHGEVMSWEQLANYIDDPSNKGALDVVKDNNQYKRFCEYLVNLNESCAISDDDKDKWVELETLCQKGVRNDIDSAIEEIMAKLEDPIMRQKMWEWVKLAHKEIYEAVELHRKIMDLSPLITTPEPEPTAAEKPNGEEEEEAVEEEEDAAKKGRKRDRSP
jgi:hypothetical protein